MPENTALELISIHVPKSGGTSFRNILESVYGEREVVRFDMPRRKKHDPVLVNREPWERPVLPAGIRVLHGHFSYEQLTRRFEIDALVPVVTWLRHPVDRVISHYFYLNEQLREFIGEEPERWRLLERFGKTMLEFARDKRNRNRTARFLQGMDLERFTFIGLMEHYQDDLDDLGRMLNWDRAIPVIHSNRTREKREVPEELRAFIAELNQEDMEVYRYAETLRRGRLPLRD